MPKHSTLLRLGVAAAISGLIAAFFALGLQHYLTLDALKARQHLLDAYRAAHPLLLAGGFLAVYVIVTALSLPGALPLTLVAGAIFGLFQGTVLVSFASTIGATLAFLSSRLMFRASVERRFGGRLKTINTGIDQERGFYLFALRLVPAFPFVAINLLMGLSSLSVLTFYWVSQLGMLAGTLVYVNAGTQLAQLQSLSGVLSPTLFGSFVLLGLFPLIARWIMARVKAQRVYKRWKRPRRYDRNLVVIGAGSAGLVSAYIAATVRAKVTLVEQREMGGDCLNHGCVPSKALIRSARLLADARRGRDFGFEDTALVFQFSDVMQRIRRVIGQVAPHDSEERYRGLAVDVRRGHATITTPWTVEVNGEAIATRSIVIAAGSEPLVPPIEGLDQMEYLTSENIWNLQELPRRLIVLGGGPIGCELAQAFARFGSEVTQVELVERLLVREDDDVSRFVRGRLEADGVRVLTAHKATAVERDGESKYLMCVHDDKQVRLPFDALVVAVGRKPRTAGYGLEELGIPLTKAKTIETDDYLQTLYPNIYACGDVAGPYQFTHTAAHQAWYAVVNALFGRFRRFRVDYSVIPAVTFTDPEVARVGLNEREAKEQNVTYEVTRYGIDDLDRAITEDAALGFVKILTPPGEDRLLGATIVGEHAGDLLAEFVLAMRHKIGLNKILGTIHAYPTWAEANKNAAGVWKKAHAPRRALRWLERYYRWQRR